MLKYDCGGNAHQRGGDLGFMAAPSCRHEHNLEWAEFNDAVDEI